MSGDRGAQRGASGGGARGALAAAGRLRPRGRIELPEYPVDAAWSPDGRTLAVGLADGALMLLAVDAGEGSPPPPGMASTAGMAGKAGMAGSAGPPMRRLPAHDGGVLAVAWQKAGRLFASSGQDGAVLLWDARTATSRPVLTDGQWSERLAFADNGRWLAVATGRALSLIDEQGELLHRYAPQAGAITALAWRPKSGEIAAAGNGGVRLHRPPPQLQSQQLVIRGACLSAAFSPDGRWLAAGLQEGAVLLWNLATGTQSQMEGYGSRVFAAEWSASGRYLATAAGNTLAVWDFSGKGPEGSQPLTYQAHSERITAIAFRPSGTWLVSAARDRRLLLWRVGGSDTPQDAHLLADECSLLRFSRDGARLAVGDARGGLVIFDCEP